MQEFNIILNQVVAMMLMAAVGYLAGRSGYLPRNSSPYISKVVVSITAPSLILSTMTSYNFDTGTLSEGLWVGLYAILFMLFSLLLGILVSRMIKLEGATANVFKAHSMFGNVGYLALPVFKALLGEKALVVAVFYVLANELLLWTIGVYLLNRHKGLTFRRTIKKFVNPNTIACMIGLVFALANLQRFIQASPAATSAYKMIYTALSPLGNCTLPLVMLFVGLSTAETLSGSFLDFLKKPVTLVMSALKLFVIPIVSLGVLLLLGDLVLPFVRTILVLELAMPSGAIIVALSAQYGSDYGLATDNVVYTTVLSLFTLPLFILLLNSI